MKKLSVVVTAYNEAKTIGIVLKAIEAAPTRGLEKEIIIVEDFSNDGTREMLKKLSVGKPYKIFYHEINKGKGAALKTGFLAASGDIVITQDADIEYNPNEFEKLITPILEGKADVVYGSRFANKELLRAISFSNNLGNRFLTFVSNLLTGLRLTDMETGYKVFRADILQQIAPTLRSNRFEIEPELTAKVARHKVRVVEVPITYAARNAKDGKKIRWRDGFPALWAIIKHNLLS